MGPQVRYLGHVLDLEHQRVQLCPEKRVLLLQYLAALGHLAAQNQRLVPLGMLQSLTGRLEWASISLKLLRLELKPLYSCTSSHNLVLRRGAPPRARLTSAALGSLRRLKKRLEDTPAGWWRTFKYPGPLPESRIWTDASSRGMGVIIEAASADGTDLVSSSPWSQALLGTHINELELVAACVGLRLLASTVPPGPRVVKLFLDSEVASSWITTWRAPPGAGAVSLTSCAKDLLRRGWILRPQWVASEDNRADRPSRDNHAESYQFDPVLLARIQAQAGVRLGVDLFADALNRQPSCPAFCSKDLQPGSMGSAFAYHWGQLSQTTTLFANPPFHLSNLVLQKLSRERPAMLLVSPERVSMEIEALRPVRTWWFSGEKIFRGRHLGELLPAPRFGVRVDLFDRLEATGKTGQLGSCPKRKRPV